MNKQERKNYLGASEIGAALGFSSFKSPVDVWMEKTGRLNSLPDDPDKLISEGYEHLHMGNVLEEAIAIEVCRRLQLEKYSPQKAYSNTKYAIVLFTYILDKKLNDKNVTVNAAAPGHAKTKMTEPTNRISKIVMAIQSFLSGGGSVEKAAQTQIYLAHSPDVEGISGKYFVKCKPVKSHKETYDENLQEKFWAISKKLVDYE